MKKYVKAGDIVEIVLPYSEVCMHLGLAGLGQKVQILSDGVQILTVDGNNFSFPITYGEAGIYSDSEGHYVFTV